MITLCPGTPQEIANIEKMLKFIGTVELKDTDIEGEPLFGKQQKRFDSMLFQRSYFVYPKGRSFLNPLKIKFVYDMRYMKAYIKTSDDDVRVLNGIMLSQRDDVDINSGVTEQLEEFKHVQKQQV